MALPIVAGAFGGALSFVLSKFVTKLIFGLGIGVVSYAGADLLIDQVESYVADLIGGVDGIFLQAWNVFGFPTALSIMFGAITTRAALVGATRLVAGRTSAAE